jgi:hypothetical protein
VRREGKVQCLTTLPDWSLTFPAAVVEECPQRCAELGPIGCVWLAITRSADGGFMCFVHDDAMVEPLQDCEHDESSLAVDADFEVWERSETSLPSNATAGLGGCDCVCVTIAPGGNECDEQNGALEGCYVHAGLQSHGIRTCTHPVACRV